MSEIIQKKRLVVLSGAGISAESGIRTFRDMGGLWEEYDIMEVASFKGWRKNQELVLNFYNERRLQLKNCEPNDAHKTLAELEKYFDVHIITQNVDNLHERAGSSNILHLHGELTKVESTGDSSIVYDIGYGTINIGDKCEKGFQLRPHIVWFGEAVPKIEDAAKIVQTADILLIIGTSLNVYPAAGLVNMVSRNCRIFLIDPNEVTTNPNTTVIKEKAAKGMSLFKEILLQQT
jgi:NAD-dependent deacetylase